MITEQMRGAWRPGRDRLIAAAVAVLVAAALTSPAAQVDRSADPAAGTSGRAAPIDVQLLSITDYHGMLVPGDAVVEDSRGARYAVGGGAYLSAHLERLSRNRPNSVRFTAGDSVSGPPYDLWHWNEPTVEFFNHIKMDFNTIGNHELDISAEYLVDHLWRGRCVFGKPDVDSCFVTSRGEKFRGSEFPHLTANIVHRDTLKPIAPPHLVKSFPTATGNPVRVAFLSLTFQRDGYIETQSYHPALLGLDAVDTANTYAEMLDREGVKAIVLSIHEGGRHAGRFDDCVNPAGPIVDYARVMSPLIDVIVSGHTHQAFNCAIDDPAGHPRPVVQAGSHGRLINEINLKIDPSSGDVIRAETKSINHPVTRDIEPDPVVARMAEYWLERRDRTGSRTVARIAGDFTRAIDSTGQSTLGNAAADAMYEDSQRANADPAMRADLAMVPVGVFQGESPFAGDLLYAPGNHSADRPGTVLFAEWRSSFGYRNPVLTVTVTGDAIHRALEGQWRNSAAGEELFRPLAVSGNVRYSFDPKAPVGERIRPADILIEGEPLVPERAYRLAALTYNLWGRDGHVHLRDFRAAVRGSVDIDAFLQYLRRHAPARPPARDRVAVTSH